MDIDNSIVLERTHFLRALKTRPLVLLRHMPSLCAMLIRVYQSRKNRSHPIPYLPKSLLHLKKVSLQDCYQAIPYREATTRLKSLISLQNTSSTHLPLNDMEDYLRTHRFANLLDVLGDTSLPPHITAWLSSPPPKTDRAWETYSCCERIANLLTWISFIPVKERNGLPDTLVSLLLDSLTWIYAHLEFYGARTNNHFLNNARALILLGVALNHQQAIQLGAKMAADNIIRLIQPQGMLRERSIHYQWIIYNWLLDIDAFLGPDIIAKMPELCVFQRDLQHTLSEMYSACALTLPSVTTSALPLIGDVSPDMSPKQSLARVSICYPAYFPRIEQNESAECTIMRRDDFVRMQQGPHWILLNVPTDHSLPHHPTHGHNDLTSFVWFYQDQGVLIDSGRSRYIKESHSIHHKSAYGHNVVLVNQFPPCCESLLFQGEWRPKPYAAMTIKHHGDEDNACFCIKHDGFKRATPITEHTRSIQIKAQSIIITDAFRGDYAANKAKNVTVTTLWHLHPSFKPVSNSIFENETLRLTVIAADADHQKIDQHSHAWVYGDLDTHYVLSTTKDGCGSFQQTTHFKVEKKCVD